MNRESTMSRRTTPERRNKANRKRQIERAAMASRTKRAARARWTRRTAARWRALRGEAADAGMSTAEYAVGTVAACAFAAALYKIVTSAAVGAALTAMIKKALDVV